MYGQIRRYAEEAKHNGLIVVIWSYPRGSGLSKIMDIYAGKESP